MDIWSNIHTIIILFESDKIEGNIDIQDIILQLRAQGKQVSAWGYVSKNHIYTAAGSIFRILGKEDITFAGKVKPSAMQVWESMQADLLLDLTMHEVPPLQQLAACAKVRFKAGRMQPKMPPYEFLIQLPAEEKARQTLCEQIMHYLQTIQLA